MAIVFDTTIGRSKLMAKIKSTNTSPELILRKALWSRNVRFRIHSKNLVGNPDLSIKKYKIVVFVDGEFWHGYNWESKKIKIKANRDYWIKKIEGNIKRDSQITQYYINNKWHIFRFWQNEIKTNLEKCVEDIMTPINDNFK